MPGGAVAVGDLRIYRDVYYTSALASMPAPAVRGRSSPTGSGRTSSSSWATTARSRTTRGSGPASPVVPGRLFLGKPFLVHLPGQVVPLQVFGRSVYWVPDPREIRYIR